MGKTKVEINVAMVDDKKKSKVMQIIAKQYGILSVEADREKNKVTVVGNENMDVTDLTTKLRRRMKCTYIAIATVTPVDEKKEKEEKEKKKRAEEEKAYCAMMAAYYPPPYRTCVVEDPSCCLM
ncbi:hypothetical protein ABZP36_035411 [Zizania latifolia]